MRNYPDTQSGSLVPYVIVIGILFASAIGGAIYFDSKSPAKTTTQTEGMSPDMTPKDVTPNVVTPKAMPVKKGHRS